MSNKEYPPSIIKAFSRRFLWWGFAVMMVLALVLLVAGIWAWQFFSAAFPPGLLTEAAAQCVPLKAALEKVTPPALRLKQFYVPAVFGLVVLLWLLHWGILRASVSGLLRRTGIGGQPTTASPKKDKKSSDAEAPADSAADKKEILETNKRFYLHLLTVLQKEGRLMDFFAEDLSAYDDAQIGAAVRSIQENCKASLKKQLNPKAVMDQAEGEDIVVPAGFDPAAIKLTGNVAGDPPFRGVLRHKGWRASRLELPTLSPARDSQIIAPAEVEIV